MKKIIAMLAATTAVSLAATGYAAEEKASTKANVEYKDNGGYETSRSSESTNTNGTKVKTDADVDVDVDSKGHVSKTVKTSSSTDPEGLMNKKSDTGKTTFEEKANGGYQQTTTRSHKDMDGTNVTYKTVTNVDIDDKGNVTTTAKTEKTVDPKGLFNSKTTTSKSKSVNGKLVEQTKKTD